MGCGSSLTVREAHRQTERAKDLEDGFIAGFCVASEALGRLSVSSTVVVRPAFFAHTENPRCSKIRVGERVMITATKSFEATRSWAPERTSDRRLGWQGEVFCLFGAPVSRLRAMYSLGQETGGTRARRKIGVDLGKNDRLR